MTTKTIQLGHTHILMDNDEFQDAFELGLQSYFEYEVDYLNMSATSIVKKIADNVEPNQVDLEGEIMPDGWRIGFVLGKFAALLSPDLYHLKRVDAGYIDALSAKCGTVYTHPIIVDEGGAA